jgi:hypothetical protein
MHWQNEGRADERGTVLVASNHGLFADIVGEMVAWCGFTPVYPVSQEVSWRSLTRTQPCIVICDCSAPAEGIQRLIIEASTRHIPLVLSDTRMQQRLDDGSLLLPQKVAWLTFPMSRDAFAAMLRGLLPSPVDVLHGVPASLAEVTIAPAVGLRTLSSAFGPRVPGPLESAMDRLRSDRPVIHETPALADMRDLRSAIATALAAKPIYDQSLRRAVWTYVSAERDAGASPGPVIMALTEIVEAARITPASVSQALTRRVILWCVEAYFGQLGGSDVSLRESETAYPLPVLVSRR